MLTAGGGTLANLTSWKLVMPLDFKMHILTMSKLEDERRSKSNAASQQQNSAANGMVVDERHMFADLIQWQAQIP